MKYTFAAAGCAVMVLIILALLPFLFESQSNSVQEEITVFAAASLVDALNPLTEEYERINGVKVYLDFASTGLLRTKIIAGSEADVFLSASTEDIDILQDRGYVMGGKRFNLLENRLVCVVNEKSDIDIGSPEGLLEDRIHRIAIADPEHAPAGKYAKESLINLGLWNKLERKLVPCADVRATLSQVEFGVVDAGIIYKTDAMITDRVKRLFTFHTATHSPITFSACILKNTLNITKAEEFLYFLLSPYAVDVFTKYGFEPVTTEAVGIVDRTID